MKTREQNISVAYKKAQKRVKEVQNFYYFVIGYIFVAAILLYRNYDGNIFNFSTEYIVWMLILQGIFLVIYGIYLFVPFFYNWEEKKIKALMKKKSQDGDLQ